MSDYRILANRALAGPIEREEVDETTVVYRNMSLIDRGVWTDSGSGQPTEYDPAELKVSDNNSVNIMHDSESDASEAGYIDADSYYVEEGTGYADVVLDLSTSAGQYADETLQETLESNGQVGFGGPSIEIPANGYDLEDTPNGYPKLVNGTIEGLGFVRDPASKATAFSNQVAQRGVAMSEGGEDSIGVWLKDDNMSDRQLQEIGEEELAGIIGGAHQDAFDSITDLYEAADDAEAFGGGLSDILDNAQDTILENAFGEGEEEADEDVENAEDDYDDKDKEEDDEEEDTEMSVEELQSELAELRTEVEQIREEHEAMMEAEAVEEELSAVREELAAADTVEELQEAKDELDKRLSKLEDEPKPTKSLSDNGDNSDEWKEWSRATGTPSTDYNSMR